MTFLRASLETVSHERKRSLVTICLLRKFTRISISLRRKNCIELEWSTDFQVNLNDLQLGERATSTTVVGAMNYVKIGWSILQRDEFLKLIARNRFGNRNEKSVLNTVNLVYLLFQSLYHDGFDKTVRSTCRRESVRHHRQWKRCEYSSSTVNRYRSISASFCSSLWKCSSVGSENSRTGLCRRRTKSFDEVRWI